MAERHPIGTDDLALDDAALEALAAAHATPPPSRLRDTVLDEARRSSPLRGLPSAVTRWRAIGTMAATLALVLSGLLVREHERAAQSEQELAALRQANADLLAQLGEQSRQMAGLRESLETQARVLQVLSGPRVIVANLQAQGGAAGSGRVLVDAASGDVAMIADALPSPGPGKTYELWAIRGQKAPEPAGVFQPGTGATMVRLPRVADPAGVTTFAVSIEPLGGSSSPTGPIVLVGTIKS